MVQIREARTPGLVSSARELIQEYSASLGIDLSFQDFDQEMAEFPAHYTPPEGRVLVAVEGGEAVGVVGFRRLSSEICELKRMYVRPRFRGRGIGRMLAKRAMEEARDAGYARMRLDTLSRLKEAVSLYGSLGFKEIAPYRVNPLEGVVYMELDLRRRPYSPVSRPRSPEWLRERNGRRQAFNGRLPVSHPVVVKKRGDVAAEPVKGAVRTEIQWLIDRKDGAPNFELRKFRIRPGGSISKHYHPDIEHEQYVLAGDYKVGIGERVYRLKAGDSVFIPAGTVHWYENGGKKDAEFLCVVPKKDKYEAIYLEETVASKRRIRQHPTSES